jgi:anhydro-N-acetylmuramic acid kinase
MDDKKLYRAIGLMSGTSLDAIDTALLKTDGYSSVQSVAFRSTPYDPSFREELRACFGKRDVRNEPETARVEKKLTELHATEVLALLSENNLDAKDIDLIGFHGQTLWHDPNDGETVQIGDGALLGKLTRIPVVNDFRTNDVQNGGQGAPLVPLYHRALASILPKPVGILNIGGISNITWIGGVSDEDVIAFDMGPGNALVDDWVLRNTGARFDVGGALAAQGKVDAAFLANFAKHPYFEGLPPKSLDRETFATFIPHGMSLEDGAATLTSMTVQAVICGLAQLPLKPSHIYVTGGGRHNATMCRWIEEKTRIPVISVDALGWNGDAVEAEAFAYLAVRSLLGLPLSMPLTTGVKEPTTGGVLHKP